MPALLLLLAGCAALLGPFPGPVGAVGRPGPDAEASEADDDAVADAATDRPAPRPRRRDDAFADAVVRAANHYLEHAPKGFRDDCSGFVCAVYDRVGVELDGNVRRLWARAENAGATHFRKTPQLGDLAFFDDTYDRDRNGKLDDPLSHVAIVIDVEPDGTIVMAHGGSSQGRTTLRMNLKHPNARRDDDGRELNDYLRVQRRNDPPGTRYLAGELWRGFATVRPDELHRWVADDAS